MNSSLVEQLVKRRGIESDYVDAWGNPAKVSDESQRKLLRSWDMTPMIQIN